jgi:hypothetical protein
MPALTLSGQSRQRQVVILAVGGVLLAGLLMFQVPRTLKMLKGDEPLPPPPTETTANPTPVSPVAPPGVAPVPVDGAESTTQHASLTRFTSKDPFVQQINASGGGSSSGLTESRPASTDSPASAGSESRAEPGAFRAVGSSRTGAASNAATIAVNGTEETVSVSSTFPKANPVFKLVSLGDGTAKVGVASGTLKGGAQTVTLTKGEPLTLLNTVDGKRYRLELVAIGS